MQGLLSNSRILNSSIFGRGGGDITYVEGDNDFLTNLGALGSGVEVSNNNRAILMSAKINDGSGKIRITSQLNTSVASTITYRIYKNGISIVNRGNVPTTLTIYTDDVSFSKGDLIEACVRNSSGSTRYYQLGYSKIRCGNELEDLNIYQDKAQNTQITL